MVNDLSDKEIPFESSLLKCIHDAYPVWFHFPFSPNSSRKGSYNRSESALVISNDFESVYNTRASTPERTINSIEIPHIAVHVTRIAKNALKTHRASHLGDEVQLGGLDSLSADFETAQTVPPGKNLLCEAPLYTEMKPKDPSSTTVVAFYFPQFHRDQYNDKL